MKVLVINCGSSSLKYQLIDMDGEKVLCKGLCERIGMESSMITHEANGHKATTPAIFPTHTEAFAEVVKKMTTGEGKCINDVSEIDAIGHRVVHGGEKFKESCLITDEVIETIRELSPLAPLHNPAGILGIEAARKVFGNIPMVAVFDTAFHSTMPPKAYMYAIPYEYYEKYGVRRYGFHGTSHKYVSQQAAEMLGRPLEELRLITCHLGNGSSICAINGGKSFDTSMGFTPLDGVIMGTRCGSVDPSAVTFVANKLGLTPNEMSDYMNKKSGFLGISGISSDNRDITSAAEHGDHKAQLLDVTMHHISALLLQAVGIDGQGIHISMLHDQLSSLTGSSFVECAVSVNAILAVFQQRMAKNIGRVVMLVIPYEGDGLSVAMRKRITANGAAITAHKVIARRPAAEVVLKFLLHFDCCPPSVLMPACFPPVRSDCCCAARPPLGRKKASCRSSAGSHSRS